MRFATNLRNYSNDSEGYPRDCRIIYIKSGHGKIFIENKHFTLIPNSLIYCCGGISYKIEADTPLELRVLNFDLTTNRSEMTDILAMLPANEVTGKYVPDEIEDSDFLGSFLYVPNADSFENDIKEIIKAMEGEKPFFRETAGYKLKKLLINLHKHASSPNKHNDAVEMIKDYISKNYTEELSNHHLAEMVGYHEYHLNRLFSSVTGMSMHQYILSLRILKAKKLLVETDTRVCDIAEICGFSSNTYFSLYFGKDVGCSPTRYRKIHRRII